MRPAAVAASSRERRAVGSWGRFADLAPARHKRDDTPRRWIGRVAGRRLRARLLSISPPARYGSNLGASGPDSAAGLAMWASGSVIQSSRADAFPAQSHA